MIIFSNSYANSNKKLIVFHDRIENQFDFRFYQNKKKICLKMYQKTKQAEDNLMILNLKFICIFNYIDPKYI